jgi:hypothetical protein
MLLIFTIVNQMKTLKGQQKSRLYSAQLYAQQVISLDYKCVLCVVDLSVY